MHAKYEVSISYGSKVIAKVKTDKQTGQKQYAHDYLIWGHHKIHCKISVTMLTVINLIQF